MVICELVLPLDVLLEDESKTTNAVDCADASADLILGVDAFWSDASTDLAVATPTIW